MPATVGAASAPLEMIGRSENHVPIFIEIEIGFVRKASPTGHDFPHFGQDGFGSVELAGNPRHRFQARTAETRWFKAVGHQAL
jgi:hypothetical protein